MRHLYSLLTMMSMLLVYFGASADKTVNLVTNEPAASYIVVTTGYDSQVSNWNSDGKILLELEDKGGFNVVLNHGYNITSITLDGTELTKSVSSSFYVEPKVITDGCTVVVTATKRETKTVTVAGKPGRVSVSYNYHVYEPSEWTDGKLSLQLYDDVTPVRVSARPGYVLESVTFNGNNELEPGSTSYNIYPIILKGGENVFDVVASPLKDVRTSTFTVRVDGDASQVLVTRAADGSELTGAELASPIPFSPTLDIPVTIAPARYGMTFYKVTCGDEEIPLSSDGVYYVRSIADGGVIDVTVDYPDVDIPVRFSFTNPDTGDAVKTVFDGSYSTIERETWLASDFSVKFGSTLNVEFDIDNYEISATCNGVPVDGAYLKLQALDEAGYDIVVTAEPKEPFTVTVYYEALPCHFHLLLGDTDDETVEMTGADYTEVKVPRNLNRVRVVPEYGWLLSQVYVNGEEATDDFTVTADSELEVYVEVNPNVGVDAVGAEEKADVFSLQGIRVLRDADASAISALPAGIYIVAGKKIRVNK